MIGMIGRDQQFREHCYIKIGYAKNIKKRMQTYKTHNPLILPMYQIAGGKELEKECQKVLSTFIYLGASPKGEWYEVSKSTFLDFAKYGFYKVKVPFKRMKPMEAIYN